MSISLLAKWLKSTNTSSLESRRVGRITAKALGLTEKQYRKMLSTLRSHLKVLEQKLTTKDYTFDYQTVPSCAGKKYRKAFMRNDLVRYKDYLSKVEKGEAKINATTLYPYDIVREYLVRRCPNDQTLNALWENLPNYITTPDNSLVMADVSGSMDCDKYLPLAVSISLALYIAERNKGAFHNHFMTFSRRPALQQVRGKNLFEKISNLHKADWDSNTDVRLAFEAILNTATKNNLPQSELPTTLYIVSDMQFDYCMPYSSDDHSIFDNMKSRYAARGYTLPRVVFWNVNARLTQQPIVATDSGVILVSGCSPAILKHVMGIEDFSPMSAVWEVVNSDRYKSITV